MKYFISLLFFVPIVCIGQTTYYSDANGMPIGTAQKSGNTTYYSNANGMPIGSAQQVGNTTYYSNANGMPIGSAQQPMQQPMPQTPLSVPSAPTFPTSPMFPSSPIGR